MQSQIKDLENKKREKDQEIEDLEKEYLRKIAELLVMTQIHCEIKTDIYNVFDKLGISSHVKEMNNDEEQSFDNNRQQIN